MSDRSCLVPRPHYSARSMRFGSRDPSARIRLEDVTEMHWPRRPGKTPYGDLALLKQFLKLEDGRITLVQSKC